MPLTVQDLFSFDYEVTDADEVRFIDEKMAADTSLAIIEAVAPMPESSRSAFIEYLRGKYAESFKAQLGLQRSEQRFGRTLRRFGRDGRDRERQVRPVLRQRPAGF